MTIIVTRRWPKKRIKSCFTCEQYIQLRHSNKREVSIKKLCPFFWRHFSLLLSCLLVPWSCVLDNLFFAPLSTSWKSVDDGGYTRRAELLSLFLSFLVSALFFFLHNKSVSHSPLFSGWSKSHPILSIFVALLLGCYLRFSLCRRWNLLLLRLDFVFFDSIPVTQNYDRDTKERTLHSL